MGPHHSKPKERQYLCSRPRSGSAKSHMQLPQIMAPTSNPITPSPTPTRLAAAPAVGKEVVEAAATEEVEVEVEVTTGPSPEVLGSEAVLPAGGVELPPLIPFEDAGGEMIVVADVAEVATDGGEDPVTAPVEAVLLLLSVHTVVVAVAEIGSESDEAEFGGDETVTLCVNVVAVVAEDEVAV